jgi:flagellin-like protein
MSVFTPRYILVPKGGMKRKMSTRKRKALSPVVASIILIAVTVAVSIAVAAWMGALTFSFTNTEQVSITSMNFDITNNRIMIIANNTGTSPVTINTIVVNNNAPTAVASYTGPAATAGTLPVSIAANQGCLFNVTYTISNGANYQVKLTSSKGNAFIYTGTAPS